MKNEKQISTFNFTKLTKSLGARGHKNFSIENSEFLKRRPQKGCQCKEFRNVAQATQENHRTEDFHHRIL